MSVITTTIERQEGRIVCRTPAKEGVLVLFTPGDDIESALRVVYAMGRADERRQTAAVLRGLMGQ